MISGFLFLVFVGIVGVVLNSAWFKGIIGEYKVNSLLERRLDKKNYKLIKDVLLPTEDGTTQIDHIVLSKYGIFVIETKNMSHWIFANKGRLWKQVIFKKSYPFQNPLDQNYKHIKTLEKLLGCEENVFSNTVVFSGNCEFKTDVPGGVVKINKLISHIKSKQDQIIETSKLYEYVEMINYSKLENTIINKINHIIHVDSIVSRKTNNHGKFDKIIKLFAIKAALFSFFIVFLFSILNQIPKQTSNMFEEIIKNNEKQQDIVRNKQNSLKEKNDQHTQQLNIKKETIHVGMVSTKNEPIKTKYQQTNKSVMYSWKNEQGARVFSNIGFPEDGKYTEGKVEWY